MSGAKSSYKEYNNRNIFRFTTRERMLLMSIDAFDFYDSDGPAPRMKIRCCNYNAKNPPGSRITDEVPSYIPLGKFLVLAHDIESGVLAGRKREAQRNGQQSAKYFDHYGGTYSDNKERPSISRRLSIVNGLGNATFAIVATEGLGEVDTKTGLIVPQKGSKPLRSIFINLPDDQLKELSIIGRIYAEQFIGMLLEEQLGMVRKNRDEYREKALMAQRGY